MPWFCFGLCRFTGTIPDEWADNAYFLALKTLTLQNNLLRGKLPNRRWNRLNGFVNMRTLDISGNAFYGAGSQQAVVARFAG